uniref:Uncharacterized protein n=1 Tax=Cajanus cajan TaxID=3821 RepID=A0A151UG27_CAJCA
MQWINEERGIVVNQKASIPISKTIHDGHTNKISFQHLGKKFVWHPLSPFQVNEDQLKLKAKKDEEEKSKNKNKKKRKEKSFSFGNKEGLGSREP